ncbi:ABC transporter substrate-binding protein [Actinoplanes couchii]|uniref:ABC transporter substrate-binding protein n=1 Tax=Actinoplanes couchii TaxID=403638 RepID=A0ABQ3XLK5_9ACTN|nr:ABC transporter substrate-binding protein [Actinoplanes couchii]MDR6318272.1 peptide/nickel transport system substrate-binding protein [Actinoplanes couchii]GID59358.1 ABC transporter substrate-binding protein [Actinoplanes couchii]
MRLPLLVVALLLTAACSAPASSTTVTNGEIAVAMQFPPRSAYAFDADDGALLMTLGVAETLTSVDSSAQPSPGLATKWEQTADPKVWRFTLRDGVTFHDGTPFNADAVVKALTYISTVSAPPRAVRDIGLTVQADGANAVLIGTAEADPVLPLRMSSGNLGILAPSAYTAGAQPSVVRTATGPYVLATVNGADSAVLERNDDYWGDKPAASKVTVRYVTDPQSRALALQSGDVQFAEGLPHAATAQVESAGGRVTAYPAARTVELLLNQSATPFNDLRVRQAVTAAIDRPTLAAQVLQGAATPAADLFGTAVPWGAQAPPAGADQAKAKELLAQAGYGPEKPLTVRLWTFPNRPEMPVLATAVQAMLGEAGIKVEVTVGDYSAQEPKVLAGDFDMFLNSRSYLSDFADAASVLTSDYTCKGSYNIDHFCSPEFDTLVGTLATTSDVTARQKVFTQAAGILNDQAVGVMIVHPNNTAGSRGVTGFVPDPLGVRPVLPQLKPAG